MEFIEGYRKIMRKELDKSKRFHSPKRINQLADLASPLISIGNQTGEGWFLTAEMLELIESGTMNIACVQPFACLPNHITGKGMIKTLKERYPNANIVAIDYDPGASNVNQLNRIKLMLSVAFKNLEDEITSKKTKEDKDKNILDISLKAKEIAGNAKEIVAIAKDIVDNENGINTLDGRI